MLLLFPPFFIKYALLLQVKEIADKLYGIRIQMKLETTEIVFDTVICSFELKFENKTYIRAQEQMAKLKEESMPIRANVVFEMFPFCILFQVCISRFCAVQNNEDPCTE